jgi:hypothetical protein
MLPMLIRRSGLVLVAATAVAGLACDDEEEPFGLCTPPVCVDFCTIETEWCIITYKRPNDDCDVDWECRPLEGVCPEYDRCGCIPEEYQDECIDISGATIHVYPFAR